VIIRSILHIQNPLFRGLHFLAGILFSLSVAAQELTKVSDIVLFRVDRLSSGKLIGAGLAGVFESIDNGLNWNRIQFPSNGRPGLGVANGLYITNDTVFIGAIDDGVYISRNGGQTWQSTGPVNNSFGTGTSARGSIVSNGEAVICGYGGWPRGIYVLNSNGTSWRQTYSGRDGNSAIATATGRFIVGLWDGGVVSSDDNGATWQQRFDKTLQLESDGNSLYGMGFVDHLIYSSTDNGNSWSPLGQRIPVSSAAGLTAGFSKVAGKYYAAVDGSGVWSSLDGSQWNQVITNASAVFLSKVDSFLFACTEQGLFRMRLSTGPRTALATVQIVNGFVIGATVTDGGSGYTNAPRVTIFDGGGNGATAIATIRTNGSVSGIRIISTGSGYTSLPQIIIEEPPFPPTQARGVAAVTNGFVTDVNVTDTGRGYGTNKPPVSFIGGGGTGALGYAVVENGRVVRVVVTATGEGYTSAPRVLIAVPPGYPKLGLDVSQVRITLNVLPGYRYQLQTRLDTEESWRNVSDPFLAVEDTYTQLADVQSRMQLFRIMQIQ